MGSCSAVSTRRLGPGDDTTGVEALTYEDPTTIRPSEGLEPRAGRTLRAEVDGVLVTPPDGTLLGLLEHPIAERTPEEADDAAR